MSEKLEMGGVERFNRWFQERVRNGCPFCDRRDWTIHDEMAVTATVETGPHRIDVRHGAPLVLITCNHCAYTAAFSATRVGIIEPDRD